MAKSNEYFLNLISPDTISLSEYMSRFERFLREYSIQVGEEYEPSVKEYYQPKWIKEFSNDELDLALKNTHGFSVPNDLVEMYRKKGTLIIGYNDAGFWHTEFKIFEPQRVFGKQSVKSLAGEEYFWEAHLAKEDYLYITQNYGHLGHLDLGLDTYELLFHKSVNGFGLLNLHEDHLDEEAIHQLVVDPQSMMTYTLEQVIIEALSLYASWRMNLGF